MLKNLYKKLVYQSIFGTKTKIYLEVILLTNKYMKKRGFISFKKRFLY